MSVIEEHKDVNVNQCFPKTNQRSMIKYNFNYINNETFF